jgi:glycosyltransferase involved in cell wall biosynthesis
MRSIAFCTPIDERSAIARSTMSVVEAMHRSADIVVFAEPTRQPLACPAPVEVLDDAARTEQRLWGFDDVVLVLGNSPYHQRAYDLAKRVNAITILHDVVLTHLVVHVEGHAGLEQQLRRFYPGTCEGAIASLYEATPFYRTSAVADFPLVEPALQHANGVVVHSEFARRQIESRTIAPVAALPLPGFSVPAARSSWSPPRPIGDGYVMATIGHANVNKLHERVIEAVRELPHLDRTVHYVIAGPIEDVRRARLLGLAGLLGVEDRVHIIGAAPDETIASIVERADVLVTLRDPSLEGASASALEQMAAGRPVIVTDQGSYAELPDDCVVKVDRQIDPKTLASVLSSLLSNEEQRRQIGERARHHVRTVHTDGAYVDGLIALIEQAQAAGPMLDVARRVSTISRRWGQRPGSPLASRLSNTVADLVAGR